MAFSDEDLWDLAKELATFHPNSGLATQIYELIKEDEADILNMLEEASTREDFEEDFYQLGLAQRIAWLYYRKYGEQRDLVPAINALLTTRLVELYKQ